MKTVLNFILALGIISLIASCQERYPIDPFNDPAEYQKINFRADVSLSEYEMKLEDGFAFELGGNSTSCNLTDKACFYIDGNIAEVDRWGNFKLSEGEIVINSTTTNCELVGQFDGTGKKDGDNFEMTANLQINCGTGVFNSNGGSLKLTISGILPTTAQPYLNYKLNIDGYLEKR